jgi:glucan biosynthesis protein C
MSVTGTSNDTDALRRTDLDWVRIAAFGLLILYHCTVFYSPIQNMANSPRVLPWVQIPMLLTAPWRMLLLFIVSGAATRFMTARLKPGALLKSRTARLLPPLIFGVLVIVPPQAFTQVVEHYGYTGSFLSFYGRYLSADHSFCHPNGHCLILPTYNHLWFVAYLWLYTLLLAAALSCAPGLTARLERELERALRGWGLVVWPVLFLGLARLGLEARWPQFPNLVNDWYGHAMFLSGFLFGFAVARSEPIWAGFVSWRRAALAGALAAYGLIAVGAARMLNQAPNLSAAAAANHAATLPNPFDMISSAVWGIDQWLWIVAILGFAGRHLRGRDGPARRYLTEAVFPFYIIHQTTIALVGHYLAPARLPLAFEAFALVTATVASCFLTYEAVRRVAWLRPLFGLKPRLRPRPRPPAWSYAAPEI